jgi:hypothetical protein
MFLKKTIDIRGGGSGWPTYDGWYTRLIYGDDPADWQPTVADVHTDPNSGSALEVAAGDATPPLNLLTPAITRIASCPQELQLSGFSVT